MDESSSNSDELDIWRDSWVRYLGYTNEVGESFRHILPRFVLPSYGISFCYAFGDAFDKARRANQLYSDKGNGLRRANVLSAGLDTMLWQTLASVLIPGLTINKIVKMAKLGVKSVPNTPAMLRTWSPTIVGLAAIPFIIHPIDHFVDFALDNTTRPLFENLVSHFDPKAADKKQE